MARRPLLRMPHPENEPYLNFYHRFSDEIAPLAVLRDALKSDEGLHHQLLDPLAITLPQEVVLWQHLREGTFWAKVLNWSRVASSTDPVGEDHFEMLNINLFETPSIDQRHCVTPRRLEEATTAIQRLSQNKGPVLIAPLWDNGAAAGKDVRGAVLYAATPGITIILDMAVLGDSILQLGDTVAAQKCLMIFWDLPTMDLLTWTLGIRFARPVILKEALTALGQDLTLESAAALFTSKLRVRTAIQTAVDSNPGCYAAPVVALVHLTLLVCIARQMVLKFPKTFAAGVKRSRDLYVDVLMINQQGSAARMEFNTPSDFLDNLTADDTLAHRVQTLGAIIDMDDPAWMEQLVDEFDYPEVVGSHWYHRSVTQQILRPLPAVGDMPNVRVSNDDREAFTMGPSADLATVQVVANKLALQLLLERTCMAQQGPLVIAPLLSHDREYDSCRGAAVHVPKMNFIFVLDIATLGLDAIKMWAQVEKLPNVKYVYDEEGVIAFRRFFGAELRNTIVVSEFLRYNSTPAALQSPAAASLFVSKNVMERTSRQVLQRVEALDEDGAAAIVRVLATSIVMKTIINLGEPDKREALESCKEICGKEMEPLNFPTPDGILYKFEQMGFTENSFQPGQLQQEPDEHMLWRVFEWRLLEALNAGVPQEHILPDEAVWDAAHLLNIRNGVDKRQWGIFITKYGEYFPVRTRARVLHLWGKMHRNYGVRACEYCNLGSMHNLFCAVGNVVATLRRSQLGFADYSRFYTWARCQTDEDRNRVRAVVDNMYRVNHGLKDCSGRRPAKGMQQYRVDFFRFRREFGKRMTLKTMLTKFATKWVLPATRFFRVTAVPEYTAPPNTDWLFGSSFRVMCEGHRTNLPQQVDLLDGIMQFSRWDDPEENYDSPKPDQVTEQGIPQQQEEQGMPQQQEEQGSEIAVGYVHQLVYRLGNVVTELERAALDPRDSIPDLRQPEILQQQESHATDNDIDSARQLVHRLGTVVNDLESAATNAKGEPKVVVLLEGKDAAPTTDETAAPKDELNAVVTSGEHLQEEDTLNASKSE